MCQAECGGTGSEKWDNLEGEESILLKVSELNLLEPKHFAISK